MTSDVRINAMAFHQGEITTVNLNGNRWTVSNKLETIERHEARVDDFYLREDPIFYVKVRAPTRKGEITMAYFKDSTSAYVCLDDVLAFLKSVDDEREKLFYSK